MTVNEMFKKLFLSVLYICLIAGLHKLTAVTATRTTTIAAAATAAPITFTMPMLYQYTLIHGKNKINRRIITYLINISLFISINSNTF